MESEENLAPESNDDRFKPVIKKWRSLSLSAFADIENNNDLTLGEKLPQAEAIFNDSRTETLGLKSRKTWELIGYPNHEGLFVIRNPFTSWGQRYWINRCLQHYPKKPNRTNIDIEIELKDWWQECFANGICNNKLLKKLRWTTFGYQHDWDTKVYTEKNKSPFPEDLAELCDVVAEFMGFSGFRAEAAIVNYYHMNSQLSPHTDHSELNLEAPLFSFSFGQSAIFLIGGQDKSVEPSSILLNSGDIVIMTKVSRLSYHAVPRIIPVNASPWICDRLDCAIASEEYGFKFIKEVGDVSAIMYSRNDDCTRFDDYVSRSRINVNVRQVLCDNQCFLLNDRLSVRFR